MEGSGHSVCISDSAHWLRSNILTIQNPLRTTGPSTQPLYKPSTALTFSTATSRRLKIEGQQFIHVTMLPNLNGRPQLLMPGQSQTGLQTGTTLGCRPSHSGPPKRLTRRALRRRPCA